MNVVPTVLNARDFTPWRGTNYRIKTLKTLNNKILLLIKNNLHSLISLFFNVFGVKNYI